MTTAIITIKARVKASKSNGKAIAIPFKTKFAFYHC